MNLKKILFFSKNDGESLSKKMELILNGQAKLEEGIYNKIDKANSNILTQLNKLEDTFEIKSENTDNALKKILKELKLLNEVLTKNLEKNNEVEKTCERLIESQKVLVSDCKNILKIQEEIFGKDDEILKKMNKTSDIHKKTAEIIEKLVTKQESIITQCDNLMKEQSEENKRVYKIISQILLRDLLSEQGKEVQASIKKLTK